MGNYASFKTISISFMQINMLAGDIPTLTNIMRVPELGRTLCPLKPWI